MMRLTLGILQPILVLYRTVLSTSLMCKLARLHIRVSALSLNWLMSVRFRALCPNAPRLKFHAMIDTALSREGLRWEEAAHYLPKFYHA